MFEEEQRAQSAVTISQQSLLGGRAGPGHDERAQHPQSHCWPRAGGDFMNLGFFLHIFYCTFLHPAVETLLGGKAVWQWQQQGSPSVVPVFFFLFSLMDWQILRGVKLFSLTARAGYWSFWWSTLKLSKYLLCQVPSPSSPPLPLTPPLISCSAVWDFLFDFTCCLQM